MLFIFLFVSFVDNCLAILPMDLLIFRRFSNSTFYIIHYTFCEAVLAPSLFPCFTSNGLAMLPTDLLIFLSFFIPALQGTAMKKPYEKLLRSYCSTSEARSLAKEAGSRRFCAVSLYAGEFFFASYFLRSKRKKNIR